MLPCTGFKTLRDFEEVKRLWHQMTGATDTVFLMGVPLSSEKQVPPSHFESLPSGGVWAHGLMLSSHYLKILDIFFLLNLEVWKWNLTGQQQLDEPRRQLSAAIDRRRLGRSRAQPFSGLMMSQSSARPKVSVRYATSPTKINGRRWQPWELMSLSFEPELVSNTERANDILRNTNNQWTPSYPFVPLSPQFIRQPLPVKMVTEVRKTLLLFPRSPSSPSH